MKIIFSIIFYSAILSAAQPRLIDSVDWKCIGGQGRRLLDPVTGEPCLAISSDEAKDAVYWRLDYPFLPGRLYELSVKFRAEPGASITAVNIGTDFFNKDLKAGNDWRREKIVLAVPRNSKKHYIRLGMWRSAGTVCFSEIVLRPVTAGVSDPRQLGDGESVNNDVYQAYFYYAQGGSNYAACLADFDAAFNTNRWDLYGGDYVIYRHDLSSLQTMQLDASLSINVNYRWLGHIVVQASRDGKNGCRSANAPRLADTSLSSPESCFPRRASMFDSRLSGWPPGFRLMNIATRPGCQSRFPPCMVLRCL